MTRYRIREKSGWYTAQRKVWWGWKTIEWFCYRDSHSWSAKYEHDRYKILIRIERDKARRALQARPATYEEVP